MKNSQDEIMNKLIAVIAVIAIAAVLPGCGVNKNEPQQAKAWCQYNTFENKSYREYSEQHQKTSAPGEQEKMLSELHPMIKVERDKLFGAMTDEQFGLLQMKANKDDWYQSYCNH